MGMGCYNRFMENEPKKYTLNDILTRYTLADLLRQQEALRLKENVSEIDERLEDLVEYLGRELTEDETSAILDIVDEYTPKDKDGNYLVELLPFEYAWEIYEAKKSVGKNI
jgi:hypothetical protein